MIQSMMPEEEIWSKDEELSPDLVWEKPDVREEVWEGYWRQ